MQSTAQKLGSYFLNVIIFKAVHYAHQGCIWLIKNTVKTVKIWKSITI